MDNERYLRFAKKTIESSIELLKKSIYEDLEIEYKSKFDLFTKVDKRVEKNIVESIKENYPEHDIVTEETDLKLKGSENVWYIDPISGSTNYAHDLPFFGISLALKYDEEIKVGVVYNSVEDEVFYAEKNGGAYRGDKRLTTSDVAEIGKAVVSTTFPYDEEGRNRNLKYFNRIAPKVEGIRRTGSVSVDLSYLSMGALDGFWALGLESWDTAAGWLLVEESQGEVSTIEGDKYGLEKDSILVSNEDIHRDLIESLRDR